MTTKRNDQHSGAKSKAEGLYSAKEAADKLSIEAWKLRRLPDVEGVVRSEGGHRRFTDKAIAILRVHLEGMRSAEASTDRILRARAQRDAVLEVCTRNVEFLTCDEDLIVTDVSELLLEALGCEREALLGLRLRELVRVNAPGEVALDPVDWQRKKPQSVVLSTRGARVVRAAFTDTVRNGETVGYVIGFNWVDAHGAGSSGALWAATHDVGTGVGSRQALPWRMADILRANGEGVVAMFQAEVPVQMLGAVSQQWLDHSEQRMAEALAAQLPEEAEIFRVSELLFAVIIPTAIPQRSIVITDRFCRLWKSSELGKVGLKMHCGMNTYRAGSQANQVISIARRRCAVARAQDLGLTVFDDGGEYQSVADDLLARLQGGQVAQGKFVVRLEDNTPMQEIVPPPVATDVTAGGDMPAAVRTAYRLMEKRRAAGEKLLRVSLRVDGGCMLDPTQLAEAMREFNTSPELAQYLIVAIDQADFVRAGGQLELTVKMIRAAGVRLAVTGYGQHGATRDLLESLRPDYIVLARLTMDRSPVSIKLISELAEVAANFSRQVMVDYVRNSDEMQALMNTGIKYAVRSWPEDRG